MLALSAGDYVPLSLVVCPCVPPTGADKVRAAEDLIDAPVRGEEEENHHRRSREADHAEDDNHRNGEPSRKPVHYHIDMACLVVLADVPVAGGDIEDLQIESKSRRVRGSVFCHSVCIFVKTHK